MMRMAHSAGHTWRRSRPIRDGRAASCSFGGRVRSRPSIQRRDARSRGRAVGASGSRAHRATMPRSPRPIRCAMRSSALVIVMLAACSQTEERAAVEAVASTAPDRIAPGVPHGAVISRVALAEHGDAALTIDNLGELRLWPSLDGKRPPVPVAAAAPAQIALGGAGDELVAAILDQAGNVAVLRVGRDGSIRGRAQISGEIACDQVIAIDDGVLVQRRDQSIERFSATGVSTGRIAPEPGEQIVAITRRRGAAMALINWERPDSSLLRWIELDGQLRWGTTVGLPEAVTRVALSPAHHRVAVTYARDNGLRVFDLDPRPRLHNGTGTPTGDGAIGFVDDDHVAMIGSTITWWE